MLPESAYRTVALVRHNGMLLLREPGSMASRMFLPLAFLILLHPLYERAQGDRDGTTQAVVAAVVTFSLLAVSMVGDAFLTERIWRTWERVRATAARPAEVLVGKAVPVIAVLLAQQAVVISFAALALRLSVAAVPLLGLVMLAWALALAALGALVGLMARSLSGLSACCEIGGMICSSLGGALVPLAALPGWIRQVAPVSPGYWAVRALQAALGGQPGRALGASGVLVAVAAAACVLAAVRAGRGWGRSARL